MRMSLHFGVMIYQAVISLNVRIYLKCYVYGLFCVSCAILFEREKELFFFTKAILSDQNEVDYLFFKLTVRQYPGRRINHTHQDGLILPGCRTLVNPIELGRIITSSGQHPISLVFQFKSIPEPSNERNSLWNGASDGHGMRYSVPEVYEYWNWIQRMHNCTHTQ